jgi:hypothetical protein
MEQGMIDAGVKLLQTVGLPTMFCWWLMFQVQKRMDAQIDALNKIAVTLAELNTKSSEGN